jgi:hypothetical protein
MTSWETLPGDLIVIHVGPNLERAGDTVEINKEGVKCQTEQQGG